MNNSKSKTNTKSFFKVWKDKIFVTKIVEIIPAFQVILLSLVLCVGIYVFIQWHVIPHRQMKVYFNELSYNQRGDSDSVVTNFLDISFTLPMTLNGEKGTLRCSFNDSVSKVPSAMYIPHKYDGAKEKFTELQKRSDIADKFKQHVYNQTIFLRTDENKFWYSLGNIHQKAFAEVRPYGDTLCVKDYIVNGSQELACIQSTLCYKEKPANPIELSAEKGVLGKRKWYDFSDISQSYYTLSVGTATYDSLNVTFDFAGQTEFSLMKPEPDEIGYNYIKFTSQEKIKQIQTYNGITFHARFPEMENLQTVRAFVLSTLMSIAATSMIGAICTILIAKRRKKDD